MGQRATIVALTATALLALFAVACESVLTPPPPAGPGAAASITVTPEVAELSILETVKLAGAVQDKDGKVLGGRSVTWTSLDTGVVVVSSAGVVTPRRPGVALISVSDGEVQGQVLARVSNAFASVSGGERHTCALTQLGEAFCWGSNSWGQLGNGSTIGSAVPTRVHLDIPLVAISAFSVGHTCGLAADGRAFCWGYNHNGQLGIGVVGEPELLPRQVLGGIPFKQITTGHNHSCGLATDGNAYCWGKNVNGQFGDGTTQSRSLPTQVWPGLSFAQIDAGGEHTCGITDDGLLFCWGYNQSGQLGLSRSVQFESVPQRVTGLTGLWEQATHFRAVSAGSATTCAITASSQLHCIGFFQRWRYWTPVAAVAGGSHGCSVATGGRLACWGSNFYGQLGIEEPTQSSNEPFELVRDLRFRQISAGGEHTCGILTSGGRLYCWGYNAFGQLGIGTHPFSTRAPTLVAG